MYLLNMALRLYRGAKLYGEAENVLDLEAPTATWIGSRENPAYGMRVRLDPLASPTTGLPPGVELPDIGWHHVTAQLEAPDGTFIGRKPVMVYTRDAFDPAGLVHFQYQHHDPRTGLAADLDIFSLVLAVLSVRRG